MMWPLLQLDPVAQGLPSGSSAYPLDQRHLSHRVESGWLFLQQSLNQAYLPPKGDQFRLRPWPRSRYNRTAFSKPLYRFIFPAFRAERDGMASESFDSLVLQAKEAIELKDWEMARPVLRQTLS